MLAAIELCHQILDIPRILKHFSDPKSVKIWRRYDVMKEAKEKTRNPD